MYHGIFYLVPFRQPSTPTRFPLITAIGMCHFLPVHHLGMASLAVVEGQNTTYLSIYLSIYLSLFLEKSNINLFWEFKLCLFGNWFYSKKRIHIPQKWLFWGDWVLLGLNRGLSSNVWCLRSANHVKFSEECMTCTEKHVLVDNLLTSVFKMGLPQQAWVEKTVNWVDIIDSLVKKSSRHNDQ